MECDFYIKEKTEHYKQYIYEITDNDLPITTKITTETVLLSNDIQVIFNFELYCGYECEHFLNFITYKILLNNTELQDEKLKKIIIDFVKQNYFDINVLNHFQCVLNWPN